MVLRWAWRQLTSMRTALLLLLLLAVAAVPGSVFPQRRIDPGKVQAYLADHATAGPWLDRFGFFDVYTSPWFSSIYLLLFVSLVGCVIPRSRLHYRAIRAVPPRTPRRLERLPAYSVAELDPGVDHAELLAGARAVLRARRYRVAEGDSSVAAERGYLAETGNLLFHLALLALLVAIAAGSYVGYSGQVIVVEGRTFADVQPSYDSFTAGSLVDTGNLPPFSLTLNSLKVRFESGDAGQLGAPRQFDASVTVRDDPQAAPRSVTIRPNQPLDVKGTRVFLVGNGYAPSITIRDGAGNVAFRGPVPAIPEDGVYTSTVVVKAPDAKPRQLALAGDLFPTLSTDPTGRLISVFPDALDPRLSLTGYASKPGEDGLGVNTGVPQSIYRLDIARMTALKGADGGPLRMLLSPGATATLPDGAGTVTFDKLSRYAAFDIRYDPTKGWALASAALALAGVTASLFVRRRRIWVKLNAEDDGRTVVQVAGLARGDDVTLIHEVEEIQSELTAKTEVRV